MATGGKEGAKEEEEEEGAAPLNFGTFEGGEGGGKGECGPPPSLPASLRVERKNTVVQFLLSFGMGGRRRERKGRREGVDCSNVWTDKLPEEEEEMLLQHLLLRLVCVSVCTAVQTVLAIGGRICGMPQPHVLSTFLI